MEIRFRTRRLERCFIEASRAVREWGPDVGRRYVQRVNVIMQARGLDDLANTPPLHFHMLTGDRAGQYAMRLTGQIRLVMTFPDPGTGMIEEVVDYHG